MTDESKLPQQFVLWFLAASLLYALVRYLFFADNAEEAAQVFLWEAFRAVVAAGVWTGLAAIPTPKERRRKREREEALTETGVDGGRAPTGPSV